MDTKAKDTKFKKTYDVQYDFRIRRTAEGNFKNLWSLEVKAPGDSEYITEIDADSLSMCVDRMSYVMEADGF